MSVTRIAAAALVALSAAAFAAPAQAGGASFSFSFGTNPVIEFRGGHGPHWRGPVPHLHRAVLSQREVARILRHNGFRNIHFVARDHRTYRVNATTFRGRPVALVVSVRSGEILSSRPLPRRHW